MVVAAEVGMNFALLKEPIPLLDERFRIAVITV